MGDGDSSGSGPAVKVKGVQAYDAEVTVSGKTVEIELERSNEGGSLNFVGTASFGADRIKIKIFPFVMDLDDMLDIEIQTNGKGLIEETELELEFIEESETLEGQYEVIVLGQTLLIEFKIFV